VSNVQTRRWPQQWRLLQTAGYLTSICHRSLVACAHLPPRLLLFFRCRLVAADLPKADVKDAKHAAADAKDAKAAGGAGASAAASGIAGAPVVGSGATSGAVVTTLKVDPKDPNHAKRKGVRPACTWGRGRDVSLFLSAPMGTPWFCCLLPYSLGSPCPQLLCHELSPQSLVLLCTSPDRRVAGGR
jgi:hypothetical protein